MKILVISNLYPPDFLGGYELGCRQAVEALRAAGHEVLVLTSAPRTAIPFDGAGHVHRRLKLVDLYDNHTQLHTRGAFHAARYLEAHGLSAFNIHALCTELQEFKPDVIYAWNLIGLGGLGLLAAIQHAGVPWVMHLMDIVPLKLCEVVPNAKLPEVHQAFLQQCRGRFISCSQTTLDEIAAGGLKIDRLSTIIPNWVAATGPAEPRRYSPDGVLRIVSAGTLSRHKGTDILIHAAAELVARGYSEFTVDLFGHCTDPHFETLIMAHDLTQHVRYLGVRTQDELIASYRDYDAFVFATSEREPFGFAPMEAGLHGCVPVVSSLCGFSEWFIDGLDCLKIDRDPISVANALEKLIVGEISLTTVGQQASRIIRRDFHLETLLPRIEDVLESAVRENDSPRNSLEETYRLAVLAERSFYCLQQERAA